MRQQAAAPLLEHLLRSGARAAKVITTSRSMYLVVGHPSLESVWNGLSQALLGMESPQEAVDVDPEEGLLLLSRLTLGEGFHSL